MNRIPKAGQHDFTGQAVLLFLSVCAANLSAKFILKMLLKNDLIRFTIYLDIDGLKKWENDR